MGGLVWLLLRERDVVYSRSLIIYGCCLCLTRTWGKLLCWDWDLDKKWANTIENTIWILGMTSGRRGI